MRQLNRLALIAVICVLASRPAAPRARGAEPKGTLFGGIGGTRRIVFLCDASGSMINKMVILKEQLIKIIMSLKPTQSFDVMFFTSQAPEMFSKSVHKEGLVPATSEMKKAFGGKDGFLDGVVAPGPTDPIPGIEAAFKERPEVIFIITDGDFPDNDAVIKKFAELNKNHKVKVNTIAFTGDGDNDTAFLAVLKQIAKESGGVFRHVKESDFE